MITIKQPQKPGRYYRYVVEMDKSADVESDWMVGTIDISVLDDTEGKAKELYPGDEIVGHHIEWLELV